MKTKLVILFLFFACHIYAQTNDNGQIDSFKQQYLSELKTLGKKFSNDFYPNYHTFYTLSEKIFLYKMDSARRDFNTVLNKYKKKLDDKYFQEQEAEIKYYFDKLLIEYPINYEIAQVSYSAAKSRIPEMLKKNLADFNKPELLTNTDFINYVRAFFSLQYDN